MMEKLSLKVKRLNVGAQTMRRFSTRSKHGLQVLVEEQMCSGCGSTPGPSIQSTRWLLHLSLSGISLPFL